MDEMPSAEFRKQYAKLIKTVVVTVNGHAIGTWTPTLPALEDIPMPQTEAEELALSAEWDEAIRQRKRDDLLRTHTVVTEQHVKATSQAQRDDLLRKINRGK
jgi:hypothetical protein